MLKTGNIVHYFKKKLIDIADDREIKSWSYICMSHLMGYSRSDCIINKDKILPNHIIASIICIIKELRTGKPLQYILGETEFYGLRIKVNKDTLIPRPETEELVKWILEHDFNHILDICTGSGCIAIAVGINSSARITALDISKKAISIAKENAKYNNVDIEFLIQDILHFNDIPKVDLIVSNPPYVLKSEKNNMQDNIIKYEPDIAIFIPDNNPLLFYYRIASLSFNKLFKNGLLFFEINEYYSSHVVNLLEEIGFVDIQLKKDINDKPRMIKALKK